MEDIKIEILPNLYLKEDGTFDLEKALQMSGKIAGLCYAKTSFHDILEEDKDKTLRRIENTLNNGHHSVYDHIWISFYIKNIPKILAMVLNNEKQYTTSEKSLRYTPIDDSLDVSVEETKAYYGAALTKAEFKQRKAKAILEECYEGKISHFIAALTGNNAITKVDEKELIAHILDR